MCHSEEQSDEESFLRRYCEDPSHSLRMTEKETMFGIDAYTLSCHSDTNPSGVQRTPEGFFIKFFSPRERPLLPYSRFPNWR